MSEGLRWHLSGLVVTPVTRSVDFFLAAAPTVDVVLLDIELHDGNGPSRQRPTPHSQGLAGAALHQDPRMHGLGTFRAGAQGILSKERTSPPSRMQ